MDKNEFDRRLEAAEEYNISFLDEIEYLHEMAKVWNEHEIPEKPDFETGEKMKRKREEYRWQEEQFQNLSTKKL